jgi:large subunit ribosomal protein L20
MKAWVYAYRDRKVRKRDFRGLWNIKINAGAREHGLSYSKLIHGLSKASVPLDRKILAQLAEHHPDIFKQIIEKVK